MIARKTADVLKSIGYDCVPATGLTRDAPWPKTRPAR
jgi:hypothetical protein